jgi:hypothetical protein
MPRHVRIPGAASCLLAITIMLVRYCATHVRYSGFPRLLGVRWNGWAISTAGGLCEACRERERNRWEADPYGEVLVPAPSELLPRQFRRRVLAATIAAAAAASVAAAALLVVHPPDLIPSGGDPGLASSGARFAGPPPAQAEPRSEPPVLSRRSDPAPVSQVVAPRAAPRQRHAAAAAPRGSFGGGCVMPAGTLSAAVVAPASRAAAIPRPAVTFVAVQSP